MKKRIYLIMIILVMIVTVCACSESQDSNKEKTKTESNQIVTGGATDISNIPNIPTYGTSVFGEDTEEWCPYVEDDKLYREELKKGKDYYLYISNYPEIESRTEVKGTINIGGEELYYTILDISESSVTYYEDEAKKQEKTIKYKNGYYRIYKRVGNRFYTLWIDQSLDEKSIKKKAKKIFDKYCTL